MGGHLKLYPNQSIHCCVWHSDYFLLYHNFFFFLGGGCSITIFFFLGGCSVCFFVFFKGVCGSISCYSISKRQFCHTAHVNQNCHHKLAQNGFWKTRGLQTCTQRVWQTWREQRGVEVLPCKWNAHRLSQSTPHPSSTSTKQPYFYSFPHSLLNVITTIIV